MIDNNIDEIKKTEIDSQQMIESIKKEAIDKILSIKNQMKDSEKVAKERLKPRLEKIKKETKQAIADYEKIAGEEQQFALEKLDDIDRGQIDKAVNLVIAHLQGQ